MGVGELVQSGPLLLALPVAAAAGAVTFLSPCCLPLVPGYLSYITGMSGIGIAGRGDAEDAGSEPALAGAAAGPGGSAGSASAGGSAIAGPAAAVTSATAAGSVTAAGSAAAGQAGFVAGTGPAQRNPAVGAGRGRAVAGTALFVLGFSAVFVSEAVVFGGIGSALRSHQQGLSRALGVLLIVLGLLFAGAFDRFSFAGRIVRPSVRPRAGLAGAPLLGVLFGVGWTPCIGPTLVAVLTLGTTTGTAPRAAVLAFVYGLGLGVPFLIVAFGLQRGLGMFAFARRHGRLIAQIGGLMLIIVGVLELTGAWGQAVSWLQVHWMSGFNSPL
ncbi:MAG TPA: cytochrome c biogenesis CcdA family protein [Streptosporangiaceae bacterium]|jgi:cytochrome c-type biogenesis protein